MTFEDGLRWRKIFGFICEIIKLKLSPKKIIQAQISEVSPTFLGLLLCGLSILIVTQHKAIFHQSRDYFNQPISDLEKRELINLMKIFVDVLRTNQIDYFVHMGTLIGSIRHHGMIPWDDDIDIYIDINGKNRLINALKKLSPEYTYHNGTDLLAPYGQWKFYKENSIRTFIHRPFKYPYLDIWFYSQNATHVYVDALQEEALLKVDVYPMSYRPFENIMIATPCNSSAILKDFEIENCKTRSFSHVSEVPLYNWWQRVVSCRQLFSDFPFTFQLTSRGRLPYYVTNNQPGHKREILQIGRVILSNVSLFQPICTGVKIQTFP